MMNQNSDAIDRRGCPEVGFWEIDPGKSLDPENEQPAQS
jgi:hypothetical protein